MKFSLVFENSNNEIEFETVYNAELLEYFVERCNNNNCNNFTDRYTVSKSVSQHLKEIHDAVTLTNSVMSKLGLPTFPQNNNLLFYMDQQFLNRQHAQWVKSQSVELNIDELRHSADLDTSALGWKLHEQYPDDIRVIRLAEAMIKLGYIFPYEEVNMTVHRLESYFAKNIEFSADIKWQVFDNPFQQSLVYNNDKVNLSFGYTYVGRQYYNKWQFWDTDLSCDDHYNYETLEYSFQLNLDRPQTVAYSPEFVAWCKQRGVPPISTQIPIANVVDIESHLAHYRAVLYKNSSSGNRAKLII